MSPEHTNLIRHRADCSLLSALALGTSKGRDVRINERDPPNELGVSGVLQFYLTRMPSGGAYPAVSPLVVCAVRIPIPKQAHGHACTH